MNLAATFASHGVVPVATIEDPARALPLAEALAAGGLEIIEVTMRTDAALASIEQISRDAPGTLVGAGTVTSVAQARDAADAGSRFVVSPGFDERVVEWCRSRGVPHVPGVMTPTEITAAIGLGVTLVKFFPAEAAGGIRTLRALAGVFPDVAFVPTGGVSEANLVTYLGTPGVVACGGSWLADRSLVAAGDFDTIAERARRAVGIVDRRRSAS